VFASTPVELSMVGSSNPPSVQAILDSVSNADSVMFKMSYTLDPSPSSGAGPRARRGALFVRAGSRVERDEWISGITEAMFMAENVSQNFADFRRMRVASAVQRDRRGTTFSVDSAGTNFSQHSQHSDPLKASRVPPTIMEQRSPLSSAPSPTPAQSVAVIKAREMMRLQQEHMRTAFRTESSASDEEGRGSSTSFASDRSESVASFDEDGRDRQRSRSRSVTSFREHGEESSEDDSDGEVSAPRAPSPRAPSQGKKFKRASAADVLPIRRASSEGDGDAYRPLSPAGSFKGSRPPSSRPVKRTSLASGARELTKEQTKMLRMFSTDDARDDGVDVAQAAELSYESRAKVKFLTVQGDYLYWSWGRRKIR
jgi:hypothetical protein